MYPSQWLDTEDLRASLRLEAGEWASYAVGAGRPCVSAGGWRSL